MGQKRISLRDMIGRVAATSRNWFYNWFTVTPAATVAFDATRPDYMFWDKLYRCKQPTARLGGLFTKPMTEHIKAWTLGKSFKATTGDEKTDTALAEFVRDNLVLLCTLLIDSLRLGDAYVVINADGSLTMASPDCVEVVTDKLDYTKVIAYKITTRLEKVTIVDEYRLDGRTVTVKDLDGIETVTRYKNLLGRLPVKHLKCNSSANEIYGRPIYEALLQAFYEYDDVLDNALKGVKAMGTPIPVLEGVANAEKSLEDLGARTTTFTDADGNVQTGLTVDFQDLDMIVTDGTFNLKGPNPFTEDSWRVLKNLFLLFLQHGNIPEWVWGGAIASSKASVDAQMPAFEKFIQGVQLWMGGLLADLCTTWLAMVSLYKPNVRALPVSVSYPPVANAEATTILSKVNFALNNGLIRKVTALDLLDLVDDPAEEVALADDEAAAMQSQADAIDNWAVTTANGSGDAAA